MAQQAAEVNVKAARCPSCGRSTPIAGTRAGQDVGAHGQVIKYCPTCGSALRQSNYQPSRGRPANLGLWLSATIAAYVLFMGYAASQYTYGSVYEGGTPKSITDTGQVAAQIAIALSLLGLGLSCLGIARSSHGSGRGWYVFAAVGAFLSSGLANALANASF